jgi:hypothetical protein
MLGGRFVKNLCDAVHTRFLIISNPVTVLAARASRAGRKIEVDQVGLDERLLDLAVGDRFLSGVALQA